VIATATSIVTEGVSKIELYTVVHKISEI